MSTPTIYVPQFSGLFIAGSVGNAALANSSLSVGLPSAIFSGSGSVALGASLTFSLQTQNANKVWAGPASGADAAPTFRVLVAADIPSLSGTYLLLAGGTMSGPIVFSGTQTGTYTLGGTPTLGANLLVDATASNRVIGNTTHLLSSIATTHVIGGASNTSGHLVPNVVDDTLALLAAAQTLTNKTISGSSNTLSNIANAALTNSSLTINLPTSTFAGSGSVSLGATLSFTYQTQTSNTFLAGPTTGSPATPTWRSLVAADIPSLAGSYLPLVGGTMSGAIVFSGTQSGTYTLGGTPTLGANVQVDATLNSRTVGDTTHLLASIATTHVIGGASNTSGHVVPNIADDTFALLAATQTLTNKTISGGSNTLSNIANASLTNSSITLTVPSIFSSGGTVSLGSTLGLSLASQAQNSVFAGLTSGVGTPAFRALVLADLPGSGAFTLTAGAGLAGGGAVSLGSSVTISMPNVGSAGSKTFATGDSITTDAQGRVSASSTVTRQIVTGTGLLGGGDFTADRTHSIDQSFSPTWTGAHTWSTGTATFAAFSAKINNAAGTFATSLTTAATAARTWTFPDATDTAAGIAGTQTLTNKTISGGSNTLSNIANASLTNSAVTITVPSILSGGGSVSLGATLALSLTSQAQNAVLAGPTSGSGTPTFRALVAGDLPAGSLSGSLTSGRIPIATGASTLADTTLTYSASALDITTGTLAIGGGTSTGLTLGKAGYTTSVAGPVQVTGNITPDGDSSRSVGASGARYLSIFGLTFSAGAAGLTLSGAAQTFVFNASGFDVGAAGTLSIGGINATAIGIGKSGVTTTITGALTQTTGAFSLTGNAQSQLTTTSGSLVLDAASGGLVDIGVTTASGIAIGRSGVTTTVTGAFTQLTGVVSITGNAASSITTSSGALTITSGSAATWSNATGTLNIATINATSSSLQLESTSNNVVIGGSTAAGVSIGRSGTIVTFPGGTLRAVTPAAGGGAGVNMQFGPGNGGPANGAGNPAGVGGTTQVFGGVGGNGDASNAPAAGGTVTITTGQPGTVGAFGGGANSGDMNWNIPAPSGTGTSGIYRWEFAGQTSPGMAMSTGQLSIAQNSIVYGTSGVTQIQMLGAVRSTANQPGAPLLMTPSAGAASDGTAAGGAGGSGVWRASQGGAGSGAQNPGNGGAASFLGGPGGTGGSGNSSGGNVNVDGGIPQGTGTGGIVLIGNGAATSSVTIGHSGMPSGITMVTGGGGLTITGPLIQGSGSFTLVGTSASSLSTSSGTLTITANAASTWDSANGTVKAAQVDVSSSATLFLGSTLASAVSVGSPNITVYIGSPSGGTGSGRTFNPFYSIGAPATSGAQLMTSPFHYWQSNYWNGTATTTLYGGIQMVPTSTTPHGYLRFGIGLSSASEVLRLDDLGTILMLPGALIDTNGGTMNIGTTSATAITIGKTGVTTTVGGPLSAASYLYTGAMTGSSTAFTYRSTNADTQNDKLVSWGGTTEEVYLQKKTVANIYTFQSTGNFIGLQNQNGDGLVAQGANTLYIYGANNPQVLFSSNNSITDASGFGLAFGTQATPWATIGATLVNTYNNSLTSHASAFTSNNSTVSISSQNQWAAGHEYVSHGWGYTPGTATNIGGLVRSSNVTTATTLSPHGFTSGINIYIYVGDGGLFPMGAKGPITVTGPSTFTYPDVGTNGSSVAVLNIWDGTGQDQVVKLTSVMRPSVAMAAYPQTGNSGAATGTGPELVYFRSSYPNNGIETVAIGNLTRSGTTVTALTNGANGFTIGMTVTLSPGETDFPAGVKTVTGTTGTTFSYTEAGSATSSTALQSFFGYAEWFKFSPTTPFSVNAEFSTNGGVTMSTATAAGAMPGSLMMLAPGQVAVIDDNGFGFRTFANPGQPVAGVFSINGQLLSNGGGNSTFGQLGDSVGGPTQPWFDIFGVRGDFQNIGIGDIATTRWDDQITNLPYWFGSNGASFGPYGLLSVGGQSRFQAMTSSTGAAVANVGTAGSQTYGYAIVTSDRNGYVSQPTFVGTSTGNATLSATNYNNVTWTAPTNAGPNANYDIYRNATLTGTALNRSASKIVTVTGATAHGMTVGSSVYVTGGSGTGTTTFATGVYVVVSVPTTSSFTYWDGSDTTHTGTFSAALTPLNISQSTFIASISQSFFTALGAAPFWHDTGAARYLTPSPGTLVTPSIVSTTPTSGTGFSIQYGVYAIDADNHIVGSTLGTAGVGGFPSPTNPWVITWTPIGGAVAYLVTRGDMLHPIAVQAGQNSFGSGGTSPSFVKANSSVIVTVTIAAGHGLKVGDTITISGLSSTTWFNALTTTVVSVTSATVFTYSDGKPNTSGSTQTVTGTATGGLVTTFDLLDYGYQTRVLGLASRNNTADMILDGQVTINAQTAGNALVAQGNASNFSALAVFKDANGNAHFGVDDAGFPSLGNYFEFRENWLWASSLVSASANPVTNSNTVWSFGTAVGTPTYSGNTGWATSPVGAGISITSPTTSGSQALLASTAVVVFPSRLANLYMVMEWLADMSIVGANNASHFMGLTNGSIVGVTHPGGYYFTKTSAQTNWQCVTDDATTTTTIDSGVTPVAGFPNAFRIEFYGSSSAVGSATVKFYIDNNLVGTSQTNIYALGGLLIRFGTVITATASVQSLRLGPIRFMYNQVASPLST